jgi:hypothetical protein
MLPDMAVTRWIPNAVPLLLLAVMEEVPLSIMLPDVVVV